MQIKYRVATKDDLPFIYSTWLKSQRRQGDHAHLTHNIYFKHQAKEIEKLFSRSTIMMICNPEDHSHVFGFACFEFLGELFIIHFVYIKMAYRKMRLMTNLMKHIFPAFGADTVAITHINDDVSAVRKKYLLTFNPFLKEIKVK